MFKIPITGMTILKLIYFPVILVFSAEKLNAVDYQAGISFGASRDVFNYETDEEDLALRGGLSLDIDNMFSFNYTELRNFSLGTSSRTWNIVTSDLSGFFDFTAGYFNLHFGSGLMMGKASYTPRDPFSEKLSISKEKTVSLTNGGNPEYSLSGTVMNIHTAYDELKIYFLPFFSVQRRYITGDSYDSGIIDSSLFTLNTRIEKDGSYTEPVNILNYGGAAGFIAFSSFNIQLYFFETDLKTDSGKDILWDKDKYLEGEGVNSMQNSGIFVEYADKNISLFIEPAISSINKNESLTDYAIAYGCAVKNSIINYSLKGKNSGMKFHSEYSSGGRTPERVWETRLTLSPLDFFRGGFLIYSRKNLTPSYNRDYIEGSLLEETFASFKVCGSLTDLSLKRKSHYSTDGDDSINQGNLSFEYPLTERIHAKLRASAQNSHRGKTFLAGGEMKFLFFQHFAFSAGYTGIFIKGNLPHYAVITPSSEHSSITCFRETAQGASIIFRYKNAKDSFYIRFTTLRTESGYSCDAESALTLIF